MNRTQADSTTQNYTANAAADDAAYRDRVAVPTMKAVDGMPAPYRALVHEYGYVDVYRAWKRGWSVERIKSRVVGGVFTL